MYSLGPNLFLVCIVRVLQCWMCVRCWEVQCIGDAPFWQCPGWWSSCPCWIILAHFCLVTGLLCAFCSRSTSEFITYTSKMIFLCDCAINYAYVCVSGGWYWVEEGSCVTWISCSWWQFWAGSSRWDVSFSVGLKIKHQAYGHLQCDLLCLQLDKCTSDITPSHHLLYCII